MTDTPATPATAADVLACIRKRRECLDAEISADIGTTVETVRRLGAELIAKGAVIGCVVTRFAGEQRVDASLYRIAGYVPPPAPGRRARPAA